MEFIEQLCFAFLHQLEIEGLTSREHVDPDLLAEEIFRSLPSPLEQQTALCTHYVLDWKLQRKYQSYALLAHAPIHVLLDRGFPSCLGFVAARQHFDSVQPTERVDLNAFEMHLSENWASLLARFFALNDAHHMAPSPNETGCDPVALQFPDFDRTVTSGLNWGWVNGLAPTDRSARLSLRDMPTTAGNYFGKVFDPATNGPRLAELTIKARMLQDRKVRRLRQGIDTSYHSAIVELLNASQRVVSVRDLKKHLGIRKLSIDPFAVEPGLICCYAPGARFLKGDDVSFAFSSWVEGDHHERGKLARVRILTPLRQIQPLIDAELFLAKLDHIPLWKALGVARFNDNRFITHPYLPHERLWVEKRVSDQVRQLVERFGLHVNGNCFFDPSRWKGIGGKKLSISSIIERGTHLLANATSDGKSALLKQLMDEISA
ncbi:MAG: hypothetical protein EOS07_18100 [Mesorhizobium sp.]|nr:MAG: hypothetical protein EOS07_18100 [Mesorhizobium sp.]